MRKEAEKTAVTKVVVAAEKAKEQELKSRTREVITTKQEQVHVTHEQVRMFLDVKLLLLLPVSTHIIMFTVKGVVSRATRLLSQIESVYS